MTRTGLVIQRSIALALGTFAAAAAQADSCTNMGLIPDSGVVLQIREVAQGERTAMVFRDGGRQAWFVPLQSEHIAEGQPDRVSCTHQNADYWRLAPTDPALSYDGDNDLLTFLDTTRATDIIDARKAQLTPQAETLNAAGVNYQLALNYASSGTGATLNPNVYGDFYGRTKNWYYNTTLGWASYGRVARYDSYALREWVDTGTFLRLGDATTSPTALGESIQFGGISVGTDRSLRPNDFSPVLPTVRNGNVLSGPLEVFINDTLQFQQTLQNGVYDLRNLPAQQGFNSYTVRTIDVQGNPVIVQREIYLPTSLLPEGIKSWRFDAGIQRNDYLTANFHYGAPAVSGNYSIGISNNSTVGVQGFVSKAASTFSAIYDQRLSPLWTGRLGLTTARNTLQTGEAVQARVDGVGKLWKLLLDWTRAIRPVPGLSARPALVMQRLGQVQWNGIPSWNLGLTMAQSQREFASRQDIATLSATTRLSESGASMSMSLTRVKSGSSKQDNLMVSLFVPLSTPTGDRNRSLFANQSSIDRVQLTRAQYTDSGKALRDTNWTVGTTLDGRKGQSAIDGSWSASTSLMELMATGRASQSDQSAQISMRSGMVWTHGDMFLTRPITGAFALVSTGVEDVAVLLENRPAGRSDTRGMLLIPELRALESNRLTVDPTTWPIHWTAGTVERQVVPPRGGGVLVSFRINAAVWPVQSLIMPIGPDGKNFPSGTVVQATVDGETRETVIDRQGQVWIAELLPATVFTVKQLGRKCEFSMPAADSDATDVKIKPNQCQNTS